MAEEQARTDEFGRTMYSATCSECGKPTEVPFQPAADRPVYCRDCYMKNRRSNRREDNRR